MGFDPGGTTGFAVARVLAGVPELVVAGQVAGRPELMRQAEHLVPTHTPADVQIVVESYRISAQTLRKSRQYDPLLLWGALEDLARRRGARFYTQTPAEAKAFATDEVVRGLGWWQPGKVHANDALRHVIRHLAVRRLVNGKDLVDAGRS